MTNRIIGGVRVFEQAEATAAKHEICKLAALHPSLGYKILALCADKCSWTAALIAITELIASVT